MRARVAGGRVVRRPPTGAGVAAEPGDDAGEDHDEAVGAGVDDPGLAQHLELLGRALDGLLAVADGALEQLGEQRVLLGRRSRPGSSRASSMCARRRETECAISRKTVSIVPSAGSRTDS